VAAWRRREGEPAGAAPDEVKRVQQALRLVRDGELSACQSRLLSAGIHDPHDLGIRRQLLALHPPHRRAVPAAPPPAAARLGVHLRGTFRHARRHKATGPSGARNEYLRVLAMQHEDVRASCVIPEYEHFAELLVNGDLPAWFTVAWSSARVVPLRKPVKPGREHLPPVPRPISIGECPFTAINTAVTGDLLPAFAEYLAPQQLAVGISGGAGMIVHGMRLRMARNPRNVYLKLDCEAAFPTISRAVIVERLRKVSGLGNYPSFVHARYAPGRRLHVGPMLDRLFGADEGAADRQAYADEGIGQGQADSPALFCVGIHDEVRAFDDAVREGESEGEVRFFMDDGFANGSPECVFRAVVKFIRELFASTGCRISGIECYSPDYDLEQCPHRAAAAAALNIPVEVAGLRGSDGILHKGFTILWSPVGDPEFERISLLSKVNKVVGAIDTTVSLLHQVDTAALGALTCYTLQSRFDYCLQLASSPDIALAAAALVDAALLRALSASQRDVTPSLSDPLVLRRIRLPARRRGLGIRSRLDLAPVAWTAAFIRAAEACLDGGTEQTGFFTGLADLFGDRAFLAGGHRFTAFLQGDGRSAPLPAATALFNAWRALQVECVGDDLAAGTPDKGPLSSPAALAGADTPRDESLQHLLSDQLETVREKALDRELKALPTLTIRGEEMPDPRLAAWMECDKISRTFAYDYTNNFYVPSCDEYSELFADYLGLPSPLAARLGVGTPLSTSRANLRRAPTVDPWGFALSCLFTEGGHWVIQHDEILTILSGDVLRSGLTDSAEVGGLFADVLPPHHTRITRRDGVRPDLRLLLGGRHYLYDLKVVRFIKTYYTRARVLRADPDTVAAPVQYRADLVNTEYQAAVRKLDAQYHLHIADPEERPLTRRLS
jgi:hypothetical protein